MNACPQNFYGTCFRSVPTTPDPNTSTKVLRYEWEAQRDTNWCCVYYFLPRGGPTFANVLPRYFSKVSGSGVVRQRASQKPQNPEKNQTRRKIGQK